MQNSGRLANCAATLGILLSVSAAAEETMLCIRGQSFEPGRELLQTRQLKFRADGSPLGDLLLPLAKRSVREKIWPELTAEEVQINSFDASVCGREPTAELTVTVSEKDLDEIRTALSRGDGSPARLNDIARHSTAKAAPSKSAPINKAAGAKRYDWVRLYFVTNRKPTGQKKASSAFSTVSSDGLTFGAVDVSIPYDHRWAKLESPSVFRLEWDTDPKRHVKMADQFRVFPAGTLNKELVERAGAFNKPGVLLFIHGYNNSFTEASQRAAQLAYDLAFPGPTVLFSWPSNGDMLSYTRDEEKTRTAWRQMAEVLDQLTSLAPGVPVYVVAHSMGNRIFVQGLAELLRRRPGADRALRQVVLASPDIGEEEFRDRWRFELKSANPPRYTLYASDQDLPVGLSAWLHGEPRLGSGGGSINVLSGLDSIDASTITGEWFGLSHSYFGDNATVMSDLFLIIHHGLEPAKRPGLKKAQGSRGTYWEFNKR
jgi:esterase/lipase superfamily enzyme